MDCRPSCAACCTAPSISSPIPGTPHGNPVGMRGVQSTADDRCSLFGDPRPETCGDNRDQAIQWLARLEAATA